MNCQNCNTELQGKYSKKFCSKSCAAQYNNKKRIRSDESKKKTSNSIQKLLQSKKDEYLLNPSHCMICNSAIPYERRNRKNCSVECKNESYRQSAQKGGLKTASLGIKRSKNEIEFANLCIEHFQNVTTNDPIFDGWDADVLIHDYKIAILWNGDWHYHQMSHKNHSLLQVENRDKHKSKLIKNAGWIEYIIKDTTDHPTSPVSAFQEFIAYLHQASILPVEITEQTFLVVAVGLEPTT